MKIDESSADKVLERGIGMLGGILNRFRIFRYLGSPVCETYLDPDPVAFNALFVKANEELKKGNIEGLRNGIAALKESRKYGMYLPNIFYAIKRLEVAFKHYDRADRRGPWNWDLSGYGLFSWKNDLHDRDIALRDAWEDLEKVNARLKENGLGWTPNPSS